MPLLQSQHEGFTFAYLYSFANNILLNPIFAISVLIGSLAILTNQLVFPFLTNNFDVEASKLSLSFAFLFGILYKSNQLLSRLALNNYVRDPSWDWTREIVLVTGGSSGIGKAIVRHFADKSIKVVILDQHLPELPPSIGATFYKVDITSSKEIGEAALKIRREVGEPTVLINNAGIGSSSSILEESDEQTMRVLETNLLAHFKLVREFLPYMIEHNHGHVVTVASMASFASMVKNASYAASKAGVQAFHESLAQEVHSLHHASRVRTSIVHPTWVRTPLVESMVNRQDWNAYTLEPESVASAITSQVLRGESAQLILPATFTILTGLRGWPNWLQELVRGTRVRLLHHLKLI